MGEKLEQDDADSHNDFCIQDAEADAVLDPVLCTLAIIDLTAKFTGMYIPLNWYSVGGSAVFGIPFIVLLILLQIMI